MKKSYRNFVATTPLFKAFISAGGRLIFEDFDAKYAFVHFNKFILALYNITAKKITLKKTVPGNDKAETF